jgi:hypothetical protein
LASGDISLSLRDAGPVCSFDSLHVLKPSFAEREAVARRRTRDARTQVVYTAAAVRSCAG